MLSFVNHTPILAAFINPAFLWAGIALASIPIIIHILNRRRFKTIQWAAMDYLLQAMRKNRRRLKFEQILLLLMRCAVLVILGLALARPVGCSDSSIAALAGQKSALHVFIIDDSLSMAYEADRPNAKTHLDQAKLLAKQQIDTLAAGAESVAIIVAGRVAPTEAGDSAKEKDPQQKPAHDPIILRPTFDLRQASEAIDRIEQTHGHTDIVAALQAAAELAREDAKQPQKYLYILTDNTRSAWETGNGELLKQIGRDLEGLYGKGRIRLNNLGREKQWNHAVLDVRPESNLVRAKLDRDFLSDIRGFGEGIETLVQWKWDDKLLPDGGRMQPDLNTPAQRQRKADLSAGGVHVMSVSLVNDERLRADNTRYRVVEVASELKVLIVEGQRSTGSTSLDLALAPKKEITPTGAVRSDSYIAPEIIGDLELGNKVLGDYRAIILTNVGALNAQQADRIAKFVASGGTLIVFMGEQVNPDLYNAVMYPRKLVPGKVIARRSAAAGAGAYTFDFRPNSPTLHPLLNIFKGEEQSGLNTTQIDTYFQVELDPEARAEVVLKYISGDKETNDPAITVHSIDAGRVVTITTTATSEWNNLPLKPAYPALIHELLAGTVSVGDRWMNLTVGQSVQVPAGLRLTSAPALTDDASKPVAMEPIQLADGQITYRSRPLTRPGLYRINLGSAILPVAVNVPAEEADLRVLPTATIVTSLGDISVQSFEDTVPAAALARDDGSDLGWSLLLVLLGLVCAECFLAMHFGHYRRKSTVQSKEPLAAAQH